jgi:hypothetical protein
MPDSTQDMGSVYVQLGEIKGILSTIVSEHARRLTDQEIISRQMRTDMTAMNTDLSGKINSVDGKTAINATHITELRADMVEANNKANAALPRTAQIMSPIVAVGALIWSFIVGGK